MKKILKFIMSLLLVFTISSCDKENVSEKFMIKGHIENQTLLEIDGKTLQEKIENEESFILTIILNGCSSCEGFKTNVLNPFILESHSTIYSISSLSLDALQYDKKPTYKVAPTIVIYKNGVEVDKVNYDYKDSMFSSLDDFKSYISTYCVEPRLIELSEEVADNKLANKESFVMYIGWYRCGDCKLLESEVLNNYLLNNDVNVYYLESDKYRSVKPSTEPTLPTNPTEEQLKEKENWDNWIKFVSKYGIDSYRNGRVPSIIYYENGLVKDYIIYRNDVIENGTITESYYQDLIGKNMTDEELLKYHNDKASSFLDTYCK